VRLHRTAALFAFAVLLPSAMAQISDPATGGRIRDPAADVANFEKAPLNEQNIQLPKWPDPEHLIRFDAGPTQRLDYFVDGASLSVDAAGVVRFPVVAKSANATNISYEGIRCDTAERKIYAYGRPDGTWSETKDPSWVKIGNQILEGYRFPLYQDYFCPARMGIRTAAEGLYALKHGGHPRALKFDTGIPIPR